MGNVLGFRFMSPIVLAKTQGRWGFYGDEPTGNPHRSHALYTGVTSGGAHPRAVKPSKTLQEAAPKYKSHTYNRCRLPTLTRVSP